jgi:hypothetical protein
MSDTRDADQPQEPAEGKAAGGASEGAEAPPADFDPAESPSNPDLVADDVVERGRD